MKDKSKTAAGVLAIVLGAYGAQYFYLGNDKRAITYLLLSLFVPGCALAFTIIGIIDGIKILSMSNEDFADRIYELRGEVPPEDAKTVDENDPTAKQGKKPRAATTSGYLEQFEILRAYKELLDSGAITEQEFNVIKSSVMR